MVSGANFAQRIGPAALGVRSGASAPGRAHTQPSPTIKSHRSQRAMHLSRRLERSRAYGQYDTAPFKFISSVRSSSVSASSKALPACRGSQP